MEAIDTVRGICHFLGDITPRNVPVVGPKPRKVNAYQRGGKALVARVKVDKNPRESVERAITLLGGLDRSIARGDKVLVKPNFNSPDPFPASTDLGFLRIVIEMLQEAGAKVTIGESSGGIWRPSRNVFRKTGADELARQLNVPLIAFEDHTEEWVRVRINGKYLKEITMPRSVYEADKLVYLPCLKTHRLARYSGAIKLAFGFVHPGERRGFHLHWREEKLAEVSLCWQPDLILVDGRKAFVTGGPDTGELVEPGLLFASGDLVAVDVEAVKILLSYRAKNRLPADPWALPQIATALALGLGAGADGYIVVD